MNKKGLIADEIANGIKIALALVVIGIVIYLAVNAGVNPFDWSTSTSALNNATSSANINGSTAFVGLG